MVDGPGTSVAASQLAPMPRVRRGATRQESRVPTVLEKVLRFGEGRILKKLSGIAHQVNALEDSFQALSDAELREETDRFKARLGDGGQGLDFSFALLK